MKVNIMRASIHLLLTTVFLVAALGVTSPAALAAKQDKLDRRVERALAEFRDHVYDGSGLLARAKGVLVFPSITKGGLIVGAESGAGALLIGGQAVGYYRTTSVSVGFQAGVQERRQFILFMEQEALDDFRDSANWEIGVDASLTLVTLDAGGRYNTEIANKPVLGFVLDSKGLMYNLTLEGQKISRIEPE